MLSEDAMVFSTLWNAAFSTHHWLFQKFLFYLKKIQMVEEKIRNNSYIRRPSIFEMNDRNNLRNGLIFWNVCFRCMYFYCHYGTPFVDHLKYTDGDRSAGCIVDCVYLQGLYLYPSQLAAKENLYKHLINTQPAKNQLECTEKLVAYYVEWLILKKKTLKTKDGRTDRIRFF